MIVLCHCSRYETRTVLMALAITAAVCLAISIFAIQTRVRASPVFTGISCKFLDLQKHDCRRMARPSFSDRSRDVAMVDNFWAESGNWPTTPSFVALAFGNGLKYRNASVPFAAASFSTFGTNLASFNLPTPEFTRLECVGLQLQASISTWVSFTTFARR